jgi:metal-responsive CopG/Arc/MetJ family transcriptional regulator
MPSAKIAVTIPEDLLAEVERLRRRTRETRSAVVQRALRVVVHEEEERERSRAYQDAYRKYPESDDEIAAAERAAASLLAEVPWED